MGNKHERVKRVYGAAWKCHYMGRWPCAQIDKRRPMASTALSVVKGRLHRNLFNPEVYPSPLETAKRKSVSFC